MRIWLAALGVMSGCNLKNLARDQFAADHGGCAATEAERRPDFENPPALTHAYELSGCNDHQLLTCDPTSTDSNGNLVPASCTPHPWCEPPGCAVDFVGAARAMLVKDFACPPERVSGGMSDAMPPPLEIAADAARLRIWTATRREQTATRREQAAAATSRGAQAVTITGCDATAAYTCWQRSPSAPLCGKAPR